MRQKGFYFCRETAAFRELLREFYMKNNTEKKLVSLLAGCLITLFMSLSVLAAAPKIDRLTLDKTTFTPGDGVLRIQADVTTADTVKCRVKILNSSFKTVFNNVVGSGKGPSFVAYWDGKAAAGNTAGLTAGEYVPKETYRVRATISYKDPATGKTVYVKTQTNVKVKKAKAVAATTATDADDKTAKTTTSTTSTKKVTVTREANYVPPAKVSSKVAPAVGTKSWDWVVQVTGNKKVDYLAEVICQEILSPGMSEYKRCKKIYAWCVMHFEREGGKVSASKAKYKFDLTSDAAKKAMNAYYKAQKKKIKEGTAVINRLDSQTPNGVYNGWYNKRLQGLAKQVGDCTHAAAMFECLCRHAGLQCDIIENSLPSSNPQHHFWNVTRIDGLWYYNDARMENARLYGRTKVKYTMFLRGKVSLANKEKRYGMIKSKYKALYDKCELYDYGKNE